MKKYLRWDGRMNRKPYMFLSLFLFIGYFIVKVVDPHIYPSLYYVNTFMMYLKFVWNAQRLHDINRTGAWTLILVPIIIASHTGPFMTVLGWIANAAFFVYLLIAKGTDGTNQYGPNPIGPITESQEDLSSS